MGNHVPPSRVKDVGTAIREARKDDILPIARNLRHADLLECRGLGVDDPAEALLRTFENADKAYTATMDGQPFLMFGATSIESPVGWIWLVSTPAIYDVPREFLRQSKAWMEHVCDGYQLCTNFVSADNELHISWLKRLGCEFIRDLPDFGVNGEPFLQFVRFRDVS